MYKHSETDKRTQYYNNEGFFPVKNDSKQGKKINELKKAGKAATKDKYDRERRKGLRPRASRAMIVGIPNVGKSTLIKKVAKKTMAKTGNTPGVTKKQQWIKVGKE